MIGQIISAKFIVVIFLGFLGCVAVLVLKEMLKIKPRKKINWNLYKKKDALFTPAERSFLGVLENAVGDQFEIFGKVRIADIAGVRNTSDRSARRGTQARINEKHLDFVLCDKGNLSVACAIELNDQSHDRPDRRDRDEFVGKLCKTIGLPLVTIRVQRGYAINEIRETILDAIKEHQDVEHRERPARRKTAKEINPNLKNVVYFFLACAGIGAVFTVMTYAYPRLVKSISMSGGTIRAKVGTQGNQEKQEKEERKYNIVVDVPRSDPTPAATEKRQEPMVEPKQIAPRPEPAKGAPLYSWTDEKGTRIFSNQFPKTERYSDLKIEWK